MNFVALDVETANSESAICQIGIAKFVNGILVEEWVSLINPEVEFGVIQTSIHKISENNVADKPKFYEVYEKLNYFLEGSVCVFHSGTGFDKNAIEKALDKYSLEPFNIKWIDSCKVARSVWPHESSHKLKVLCEKIGFEFNHHDALQDARACAQVLLAAIKESNQNIDTLMEIVNRPIKSKWEKASHSREGNPDGGLFGEVILFSDFSSEDKERYSDFASQYGCNVVDGYSKKVTILVVPRLDVSENEKTGKYKKVEEGIAKGLNHQLLDENGFLKLIESATTAQ